AEVRISGVDVNEGDESGLRVIKEADEYVIEVEPGTYTLATAQTSSAAETVEHAVGSLADLPTLEPTPTQQATVQVPEWTPEWSTKAIGLASSVGLQSGDGGLRIWLAGREKPGVSGLTVETWVKPENLDGSQAVVSKWNTNNQRSFMVLLKNGKPIIWTSPDGSYDSLVTITGATELEPGWHHLAATWDGETLRLFVDGVEEASQQTQSIFSSGNPILLGQYAGGGYQYRGLLDDARVYDEALPPAMIQRHASARGAARDTGDKPTPVWACSEPEDTEEEQLHNASWIQVGENHALELTQDRARVISDTASRGLLTVVDESGQVITRKETPAKVTAVCPVPDSIEAKGAAFVAGLDNDVVMALDSDGETLWTQKAEVHQEFWYDGHWRAPWFTDPQHQHGIKDLTIDRLDDDRAPEIILGRACTVELRALDGELQGRVPIKWGDAATLQTVPDADGGRAVLAGKFGSVGHPGVSLIGPDRELRTNDAYGGLPDGYSRITGWHAQGILHLLSEDLENDGREELILVCCGSWNEIRVYDALTHEPKWAKAFGPGEKMARFIPDIVTADLTGDGAREIALCGETGWVWVFSANGELLWARRPLQEATALAALNTAQGQHLVVGSVSGNVVSLDADGNTVAQAEMQSRILDVSSAENEAVIVVTEDGTVSRLSAENMPAGQ
ncbi:MAG: LamG domain-containing protein, partial [Armatimonadota bacterium]